VLLPAVAVALYLYLGEPGSLIENRASPQAHLPSVEAVEAVVAQLAEKMAENPDDPQGWALLGRSYMSLARYAEAVEAYTQLYQLDGDDPDVMLSYAEALALSRDGDLSGQPNELIERALATAPRDPTALWLAGLAARQRGENDKALDHWQMLLPLVQADPQALEQLQTLIAEVPTSAAVGDLPDAASGPALTVNVSLAENLQAELGGDETLFVYARAVNGPPMPLAVARRRAGELPLSIVLDDRMAMTPNARLSDHELVNLTARISHSGQATPQSGDLIGELNDVSSRQDAPLALIIDRRQP
jgi:cytochrome c-type biogenesis protein CcmH